MRPAAVAALVLLWWPGRGGGRDVPALGDLPGFLGCNGGGGPAAVAPVRAGGDGRYAGA